MLGDDILATQSHPQPHPIDGGELTEGPFGGALCLPLQHR